MTQQVDPKDVRFECGKPSCRYDKIYRCFKDKGNGLLFRLVNDSDNTWSFYNDTKDTVMKIRAKFGASSKINVLGKAKKGSNGDEIEVTLEVAPGKTEPFISGLVNGFSIGFQTEAAQEDAIHFENGKPNVAYDKVYKCFKNDGMLFRLVDTKAKRWYFYNDTPDYLMTVTCEMDNKRAVKLLGKAKATGTPSGNPDGVVITLEVGPNSTEPFIEGDPSNYRLAFSASGAATTKAPEAAKSVHYLNGEPNWKLIDRSAQVYPCFKDDSNGLLFRYVDAKKNQWTFYNDTKNYNMTVTIGLPDSEAAKVKGASGTTTVKKAGKTEIKLEIPPLATMVMLNGMPASYEIAFGAEGVRK